MWTKPQGNREKGVYQVLCTQCRSDQYHQESGFKHLESGRDVVVIKQNMRPVVTISLEGRKSYALFSRYGHGRSQSVNWEVKPGDGSMIVLSQYQDSTRTFGSCKVSIHPHEEGSAWDLHRQEALDIMLPSYLIDTDLLRIWSAVWYDYVSVSFAAVPLLVNPFSELGQKYQLRCCIGCGSENLFYEVSTCCPICTTVLLCYFTDKARYEVDYITESLKDSVYDSEVRILELVGTHVHRYWSWTLSQLVDRNRCILRCHPLATGNKLGRSIQDFAHMRTGLGSRLGLGINCGSERRSEPEKEYPEPGLSGGNKRDHHGNQSEAKTRRRRSSTTLTEEQKKAIFVFVEEIHLRGKKPGTMKKYSTSERHWTELFEQMGWHPLFMDCDTESEKARRTLFYVSYEVQHQGILSRSVRQKLSGIAWMFVKNYLPNPFNEMPALTYFMRHLTDREPKSIQKIPAPPALLEYIMIHLDRTAMSGAAGAASLLVTYWYCARGGEVFAESEKWADPDRVIYWKDIIFRESLEMDAILCSNEDVSKATAMTVTLRSDKNALHTCTRTVTETPDCEICAVAAVKNLHAVILTKTGAPPNPTDAICMLGPGKWLSCAQVSFLLKAATESCGCKGKNVATHSLRRGGASAYFCAGVPIEDIKIFGRWLSDAYKLYIFLSSTGSIMSKGNVHPTSVTPRFEKN